MRTNFSIDGMGAFGIILGIVGLGYGAWQAWKIEKRAKRIGVALDEVDKKTTVEIEEAVVNAAIERAVDREVEKAVKNTARKVRDDIKVEIHDQVKKEVEANFDEISNEVADKISEQVAAIDEYALKEKVTKEAEKKILKKFDGSLDGVLGDFNGYLKNVRRVYENVADVLQPGRDRRDGTYLRIN